MSLATDYQKLHAFAVECARSLTFSSADATAMGVRNALAVLKLDLLEKPEDAAAAVAEDKTKDADPEPPKKTEKTK